MTGQLNDSCPDLLVISRYNYLREGFVADELFKHWKQEVRVSLSFQAPSSSPKTFFISSSGILCDMGLSVLEVAQVWRRSLPLLRALLKVR